MPSLDELMADLSEMILGLPDGLPSEKRQQVVPFPFKPGEYQQ